MRTIALLVLTLTAAGCVTSRQVLSRRAQACSVTLTRPGFQPRTIPFERLTTPVSREAIKSGLLIGGLAAMGGALSAGSSHQQAEALGGGVLLAGIFIPGEEVTGARTHFEPEVVDVRLERAAQ